MNRWIVIPLLILLLCFGNYSFAAHRHKEREYQEAWCTAHNGTLEYVLDDGARVDCLTEEYAVEFDFAPKWAEAIGQSLYYSLKTGKRPAVVLIIERGGGEREMRRLRSVSERYGIMVWTMRPEKIKGSRPI
ncbi:MAG: hypothetical protein AB1805_07375 [Nitrospirota bacterium]